ncbi:hypothetical protein H4F99_11740 [Lysobacter sp. SG-8]|uniref:STAS/SEC14 domain-containing protein n=1 Tax=Marilutibacter penaei TaxID=2759900 RepID=A0A7W3U580_9GAMM|nr:hypothetical protein [Lysobacter penaei]MBB1089153.1 hypothetical protein [Lysobacter penaei]
MERPYTIEYEHHAGTLSARVSGVNGLLSTTLAYWQDIASEVRRLTPKALLVIDQMEGAVPPPDELMLLVDALVGQGFEGVRVAYVESDPEQIPEVEMAEILARERGYQIRVFGDAATARVWLQYGTG